MGQRVSLSSKLKSLDVGVAKASLNRALQFDELDPKPSELTMARLKAQ